MSALSFMLVAISLAGVITILLVQARRDFRETLSLLSIVLILASVPLVMIPWVQVGTARGGSSTELWFLVVLYICLLLGMLAQHVYARFSQPRRRRHKFDLGIFLAPIFASPIVFIPLLAVIQAAGVNLYQANSARAMLFLVAFENGFFWKVIFDQRRQMLDKEKQ